MCIGATVLAPVCTPPSTTSAGSTVHSFPHVSQSVAVPPLYLPSDALPGLTLSHLSTASARPAFVPFFTSIPGSTHIGIFTLTHFRGEIMPGIALVHAHFPLGPSTQLHRNMRQWQHMFDKQRPLFFQHVLYVCFAYIKYSKISLFS